MVEVICVECGEPFPVMLEVAQRTTVCKKCLTGMITAERNEEWYKEEIDNE